MDNSTERISEITHSFFVSVTTRTGNVGHKPLQRAFDRVCFPHDHQMHDFSVVPA